MPYGELLEATRATLTRDRPLPRLARAILWVFARPAWLAFTFAVARLLRVTGLAELLGQLPGRPGFGMAMLAATASPLGSDARRRYQSAEPPTRGRVALLRGCVMHGLFRATNRATARTLAMNGYEVVETPGQGCCGALHAHAGDEAGARAHSPASMWPHFQQAGLPRLSPMPQAVAPCSSDGHCLQMIRRGLSRRPP